MTIASGVFSSSRPKAAPISTLATWNTAACGSSCQSYVQAPAPPVARAASVPTAATARLTSTDASAASTTAASLATITRSRRGTSANVVSAVRCDHSPVMERMPSTGSSRPTGSSDGVKKAVNVWSGASRTNNCTTTITAAISPIVISSQRPARVSASLRSSTAVSRASEGPSVTGSCRAGAVGTAVVVIGRPPWSTRRR